LYITEDVPEGLGESALEQHVFFCVWVSDRASMNCIHKYTVPHYALRAEADSQQAIMTLSTPSHSHMMAHSSPAVLMMLSQKCVDAGRSVSMRIEVDRSESKDIDRDN
jgi:hypothetical protein